MAKSPPSNSAETNRLHRDFATAVVTFQEAVARSVGMSAAERKCAGLLAERGRMTPGELAQETGLTTGAITGIVDRLSKAGYAARVAHPTDRRSVIVEARHADELMERMGPPFAAMAVAMGRIDARYSEAERALIHRHLADTTAALREETARLMAQPVGGARAA